MDFYHDFLAELDIQEGDILDIVSDSASFREFLMKRGERFSPDKLLNALQNKVGETGTLLIRTFNWDFCRGVPFNYKKTPGKVGILGNAALRRKDFRRTRHPIYSWAVWGKDQEYLCELNNRKSFGVGTPWDYFEKGKAKIVRLGNAQVDGFTFLHHIEQELEVPYRFEKTFSGTYIDEQGNIDLREYSMFVRYLDRKIINNEEGHFQRVRESAILHEWMYCQIFRQKNN